jgi:hypothetical protein
MFVGKDFVWSSGEDYRSMVLSIIKKTMSKSVALQFSTFGKKGKRAFSSLRLHAAVMSK